MSDLYRIPTQKTYKGRTAGGFARKAKLVTCAAGNVEIVHDELPGCIITPTVHGNIVVSDLSGALVSIECSARAFEKFSGLARKADRMMGDY